MSQSFPADANANLPLEKQINDLTDPDLCAIFERLPLLDRLIASEVCRRWNGLTRKAWLDITKLELGPIPGERIGAIVRQCTNVKRVFAVKKSFDFEELASLARARSLFTVKLYGCRFTVKSLECALNDGFAKIFSENLQNASWDELVLHDVRIDDEDVFTHRTWTFTGAALPAALTRLQLSGVYVRPGTNYHVDLFLNSLERLVNLECLICAVDGMCEVGGELVEVALPYDKVFAKICALENLKELCLGPGDRKFGLRRLTSSLPKLEVLFLNHVEGEDDVEEVLTELITKNSALRILVLPGVVRRSFWNFDPINIPARKRFPRGFGSDPLRLLHVFVGKAASDIIRFAKSASDAAIIHSIDQWMPEYLDRKDIAPIFDGVWIVQKIREAHNADKPFNAYSLNFPMFRRKHYVY